MDTAKKIETWNIEVKGEKGTNLECGCVDAWIFCGHPDVVDALLEDEHALCHKEHCPLKV